MRDRGTFNFSGNLEVKKDAPLEARSLVGSYTDLTKPETWTDEEGGVWIYGGMNVTCKDRPGKIYQLSAGADYTQEEYLNPNSSCLSIIVSHGSTSSLPFFSLFFLSICLLRRNIHQLLESLKVSSRYLIGN